MNSAKRAWKRIVLATAAIALVGVLWSPVAAQADYEFGFVELTGGAFNSDGTTASQAASHPYSVSSTFKLTQADIVDPFDIFDPGEQVKDVEVELPPGFIGNPGAIPSRCTNEQLFGSNRNLCPVSAQVGVTNAHCTYGSTCGGSVQGMPIFNMVPPPGKPAMLAFALARYPVFILPEVRSDGDYGLTVKVDNIPQAFPVIGSTVTLWGVPADPSHDSERGTEERGFNCADPTVECTNPAGYDPTAFITLSSNCAAGAQATTMRVDSWQDPGDFKSASFSTDSNGNPVAVTGCEAVPFEPTFEAKATTNQADTPTGLDVAISVPSEGLFDPDGLSQAHLKKAVVTLPQGMTVNAASADGLGACSSAQIGLTSPIGAKPIRFTKDPANCPDASKIGTVEVDTPLLDHPLHGFVFLASQNDNPFNSLLATYITLSDPETGIVAKLAGHVVADPNSGQLTATFDENPQIPFEDFEVHFFGGNHASLKTPATCGTFATQTSLEPWSAPEAANAFPPSSFEISEGVGGSACLGSESSAPNNPSFAAGTVDPTAAAYSPFLFRLTRADGTQQLKAIDTTLPKGLLGKLAGTPSCPDGALAVAAGRSGRSEQASPSCPLASQVGTVTIGAGAGSTPLYVGAKAYLAGPYRGAPLSLAIVTPAVAGPFDLGNVVVRTALNVDPESAQIHAVSDPLPRILEGIPLNLRSIALRLDKPNFTLNPTSCNPMSIDGSALSVFDQSAPLSNPFQVGECSKLGFKPKLQIRLKGGTKRSDYPALTATLTARPGDANIARTTVALPHSEFLAQSHIRTICTRVQFAAEACPPGSVYGSARAFSPLLDEPLEGPVYLRSSSNPLPDLVIALDGRIDVDLVGRIDSVKGGIRTSFESVPDAPVSKFVLAMKGGKKGLLENSRNLCKSVNKATVQMDAQNGKAFDSAPVVKSSGCKKAKKVKKRGGGKQKG